MLQVESSIATIRPAVDADIPRLVEMGRRFRSESTYTKFLAENPERMAELARTLIVKDGLLLMEREAEIVGMLGFILHDHFISGERFAGEVFWWTEPEHRGHGLLLLDETKRRAKISGAKYLHMIAPSERVSRLYKHLGFEWVEATHQIAL